MAIVDEEGRLFGRVNLIDACIVSFAVLVIPVSIATYRVFSVPRPEIAKVEPVVLTIDGDRRLRLTGRQFRPYLKVFFGRTGEPFSLSDLVNPDSGKNQATLRVETPSVVELTLPDTAPGTYDLYVYDEGREVARRMSAFTVAPGIGTEDTTAQDTAAPVTPREAATLEIAVRFDVDNDIAPLVKAGDVALNQPETGSPSAEPAVLVALQTPAPEGDISLRLGAGARLKVSTMALRTRLEGVVRLGAVGNHGVWEYPGPQRLRAGETFSFASRSYVIEGTITRITVLRRGTGDKTRPREQRR